MRKLLILLSLLTCSRIMSGQVEIIAHRGASYIAPENTIASSKLAWELGADAVEVDIYLSKDNKIICMHDSNTKRTTGQEFKIKDTRSGILRKLDAGSFKDERYKGEKIPFLREVINEVPEGKELVIEIKCGSEILPFLEKTIRKSGKNIKYVFIAFDFQTISDTKKKFPKLACYWLCSSPALLEQNLDKVHAAALEGVSLNNKLINERIAKSVKDLGLELFAWTVDDPEEAKRLISLGVKGITTNRPGWLYQNIF